MYVDDPFALYRIPPQPPHEISPGEDLALVRGEKLE
jgi:hypothetical protein